jgi:hypothetical protein
MLGTAYPLGDLPSADDVLESGATLKKSIITPIASPVIVNYI